MVKQITILLIACSSCSINKNVIFYSNSIKKSIHNLEQIEMWLHDDIENGDIDPFIGEDYMVAITHTKLSLKKKLKDDK